MDAAACNHHRGGARCRRRCGRLAGADDRHHRNRNARSGRHERAARAVSRLRRRASLRLVHPGDPRDGNSHRDSPSMPVAHRRFAPRPSTPVVASAPGWRSCVFLAILVWVIPKTVAAHTGTHPILEAAAWQWTWEPFVLVPLAISTVLYAIGVTRLWRRAGNGHGI